MKEFTEKIPIADLEMWEYVIKLALEFDRTPEDLGYSKIETSHGVLWLSKQPKIETKYQKTRGNTL